MKTQGTRRTAFSILVTAMITTFMISCGDAAPDMMSDAMVDAGELLMDGGRVLMDGGRDLDAATDAAFDAMPPSDAAAQDGGGGASCGSCNAAGMQRIVTADTDPARLESGSVRGTALLVLGPIVITDFSVVASSQPGRGRVYVSDDTVCNGAAPIAAFVAAAGTSTGARVNGLGMRVFVPAGQAFCADPSGSSDTTSWAGFRPY